MKNSETFLQRLSITMGELKARYPTKEEWAMSIPPVCSKPHKNPTSVNSNPPENPTTPVSSNPPKNPTTPVCSNSPKNPTTPVCSNPPKSPTTPVCSNPPQNPIFYTSNVRTRGMAFYKAYGEARVSDDMKKLCTYVASMLCDVYDRFRSSMEEALHGIGVIHSVVWLPANKEVSDGMVWPFILVNFGCLIIMLLKKFTDEVNYKSFMIKAISDLKQILRYDADLDIPFGFKKAIEIRTNLGYCSILRQEAIRFILKKSNNSGERDQDIGCVCRYLRNMLAWSEMHHFKLIKENLVDPQSLLLDDPRIAREVAAFTKACESVRSHICPPFFMFLAPTFDILQVDASRFPTLIAIAQELKRIKDNNSPTSAEGAHWNLVRDLVKLHRETHAIHSMRRQVALRLVVIHSPPEIVKDLKLCLF